MIRRLQILLILLFLHGCSKREQEASPLNPPADCRQILLVESKSWDDSQATLQKFEIPSPAVGWQKVGESISVTVGRSGMGWGRGLHTVPTDSEAPSKVEGDGKAPAGIFTLSTAFGYASAPKESIKLPYRQASRNDYFVDDPSSKEYNQWVHLEQGDTAARQRWKSFEWMRRNDNLYELGIVVDHNMAPTKPGSGSAIFIHLWSAPGNPTAGCTAMSRADIVDILTWLDPDKKPVLFQAPSSIIEQQFQPTNK